MSRRVFYAGLAGGSAVFFTGFASYACLYTGQGPFDTVLRTVVKASRPLHGFEVSWRSASGKLGGEGSITFEELRVKGQVKKFRCDLLMENFELRTSDDRWLRRTRDFIKAVDGFGEPVQVPLLRVDGVRGEFELLRRNPETPLPNVVFEHLDVTDVKISMGSKWPQVRVDHAKGGYAVRLPLHSVLFRLEAAGAIGSKPFSIKRAGNGVDCHFSGGVEWVERVLPSPLDWIQEGDVNLELKLRQQSLSLRGDVKAFEIVPPPDLALAEQPLMHILKDGASFSVEVPLLEGAESEDELLARVGAALTLKLLASGAGKIMQLFS